jgi:hypothetical protein
MTERTNATWGDPARKHPNCHRRRTRNPSPMFPTQMTKRVIWCGP